MEFITTKSRVEEAGTIMRSLVAKAVVPVLCEIYLFIKIQCVYLSENLHLSFC